MIIKFVKFVSLINNLRVNGHLVLKSTILNSYQTPNNCQTLELLSKFAVGLELLRDTPLIPYNVWKKGYLGRIVSLIQTQTSEFYQTLQLD